MAALFVDPRGVYSGLPDVDVWDESRDARLYAGPYPVVAHPPCARWSLLAPLVESLHGIPRGEDGGCFESALRSVRLWGGVLEHPCHSRAWYNFFLPPPRRGRWIQGPCGNWVTELSQSAYGHRAQKRTWLYAHIPELPLLDWSDPPGRARMSGFNKPAGVPELTKRERSATPIAFRDFLLGMARSVYEVRDDTNAG